MFESRAQQLRFDLNCNVKRTKINKKGRDWRIKIFYFVILNDPSKACTFVTAGSLANTIMYKSNRQFQHEKGDVNLSVCFWICEQKIDI